MLASKLRMTGEAARGFGRRILHRREEVGLPREDQIPDRRVLFNLSRREPSYDTRRRKGWGALRKLAPGLNGKPGLCPWRSRPP